MPAENEYNHNSPIAFRSASSTENLQKFEYMNPKQLKILKMIKEIYKYEGITGS